MQIGLLITSHKDYKLPLSCLLRTVLKFDTRVVISGGHNARRDSGSNSTHVVCVEHDSYEYTGLIEVLSGRKLQGDLTHVLCVQDTMELGPLTHELCQLADPQADATAAAGGQCNLVLYRLDYLATQAEFIRSHRNCSKLDSIRDEGALWKMAPNRQEFPFAGCVNLGMGKPYSDVPRLKEYYPSLQVVKWKANYGQNMHSLITEP